MKKTVSQIVEDAINHKGESAELIRAIYWMALSQGQEAAESKIRKNLQTLPQSRYHGVQKSTIDHILKDNPCALKASVCPDYAEMSAWDFEVKEVA